ncbi:glycerophosphodiester phosphodiesterase [Kribbella italica]|uniref:Glycerophosphoryl diester phosphodiesterase n=1 Tax=Kribbella italica TaxID=1540520 RepID=A0A7W9MRG5_9ACTN|nr:glycerophosphodiester phosphodiesterase [Kribbella italica]MBB5833504.1 glycerophosphoryl diester phosphodiesterase [Kribbella italica]
MEITRRTALGWIGALTVGAAATGCRGADAADGTAEPAGNVNLTDWVADRGNKYLIAHRGIGDLFPEHSIESYQAAFDAGAQALEISVGMTSDNVLVCLHDQSLDRTTNLAGLLSRISYADLQKGWIDVARLGPYWQSTKARVPLFEEVLKRFGGRVILCVEAKDGRAHAPMMSMIAKHRLETSVMLKTYFKSKRITEAKRQGLGVFAYYTTPAEMTIESVQTVASLLSPRSDAIVVPNSGPGGYLAAELVDNAVATGMPIWPYPLHRRSDLTHYTALGMAGAVTSNITYLLGKSEIGVADQWARGIAVAGELTRDPYDDRFALQWGLGGSIRLAASKAQHFLTLGNLGPITVPTYSIEFEASYDVLPKDPAANLTLAFGHSDDRYYEHRQGLSNGYHAIMQRDGEVGLYQHEAGKPAGTLLGSEVTAEPVRGRWMKFRLEVTPTRLTWSRLDRPARITVEDNAFRGGYLHLGRGSLDGTLSLRGLKVTRG